MKRQILTPYPYQQDIIDRFKSSSSAGLFLEPGCGKTITALGLWRLKCHAHGKVLRTIVFCPIIVLENWKREFLQCTHIDEALIGVVRGTTKKRLQVIRNQKHKVLIVNYEAMRSNEVFDALMGFDAMAVIGDESHMIKSPKLKTKTGSRTMTKSMFDVSRNALYRWALSGTPQTVDFRDLWSQYYFLDRGKTLGDKYYHFQNRYFVDKNASMKGMAHYFPRWEPVDSLMPEIEKKIEETSARLTIEECVDLPKLVEQTVEVEMSPEQRKHYNELRSELITWVDRQDDNPLAVQNALTKVLRLNEIMAGYMRLEDDSIYKIKKNPRLDSLVDLVEMFAPHKVIVFSVFKESYTDLAAAFSKRGISYTEIHGGVSAQRKLDAVEAFEGDPSVRVCIANPQSGGVGINLKSARYSVFYTRSYSMRDYEQAVARNYRSGSIDHHETIFRYNMVAPDTIDAEILESIKNKKNLLESMFDVKRLLLKN